MTLLAKMRCECCPTRKYTIESGAKKEESKTEEEEEDPRDKGWAWVVVTAIAIFNILLGGTAKANGVFYVEWLELHGQSPAITSWARTAFSIVKLFVAPISSYLRDRLSFQSVRILIFVSGLVWALSLCVAGWMPNMEGIIATYSIIGGAADGLLVTPIFSLVPYYFVKRRSLASGIALAGGSVGGLLIPILVVNLTETYTIRGAMTIIGALYLHTVLAAMVMIPLKKPKLKPTKQESPKQLKNAGSHINEAFTLEEAESEESRDTNQIRTAPVIVKDGHQVNRDPNLHNVHSEKPESCIGGSAIHLFEGDSCRGECIGGTETYSTENLKRGDDGSKNALQSKTEVKTSDSGSIQDTATHKHDENKSEQEREDVDDKMTSSSEGHADITSKMKNLKIVKATRTYIDFLRTPHMIPLALTFLCACFAYFSQFVVLVPFTTELGGSKVMASTIISVISVTELFARILTGYIADRLGQKKMWLLFVALVMSSIIGVIIVIFPSPDLLYGYAVAFGIFGGMHMPLAIPMATDLVSSNQFGKATGLLPIVVGLGIAIGNQGATAVFEGTNSYKYSLLLCVCMYLAALFFFGIYAFGRFQKGKKKATVIIARDV